MSAAERVPESVVRMAIEWQMRMRANAGNAQLQGQLQDWLQQDHRHQVAWQRLQQMGGLFNASHLPDAAQTIPLLQRAEADLGRRRTLKLLGLGLAAGSATLLATQTPPAWHADFSTAVGERRRVSLAGGAEVLLNSGSALDVQGDWLLLRAGEALVEGKAWQVRCRFAECLGRDARVALRERGDVSEIYVERGEVLVSSRNGQRRLRAGEGVSASSNGLSVLGKGPLDPFAWSRGLLVVSDIRLVDFLAEAGRYRRGWLGCDEAIGGLRLSGVFRLDEPGMLLDNITHLLPVKIVERTRWWVRVTPA